jgi:sugar/nucleoside kinase (ribokinase family)
MSEHVVYQVMTSEGPDRLNLGTHPNGVRPDFAEALEPGRFSSVVVNSLPGEEWGVPLVRGKRRCIELGLPYDLVFGKTTLDAVEHGEDQAQAVYDVIDGSRSVLLNKEEWETLIRGSGRKPARSWLEFLDQGLELGSETVVATNGGRGAYLARRDGIRFRVGVTRTDRVRNRNGAGDRWAGAFLSGPQDDPVESMRIASGLVSLTLQKFDAQDHPPTLSDVDERLRRNPQPVVEDLVAKRRLHIT